MAALPDKASFTDTKVSKGGFRAALDQLNDYLAGLLGTSGTAGSALEALGVKEVATKDLGTGPDQVPTNSMLGLQGVRPEVFGAVGDGVTDDAAALQEAFNAAVGGEVQLAPGATYISSEALTLPDGTTLQLNGATLKFTPDGEKKCLVLRSRTRVLNGAIDCAGTNITGADNGDLHCPILIGDYDGGAGYSDIVVDGVTITSNRENGNGILVTGDSHNIVLRNLRFPDSATMGRPILLHWGGRNGGAPVATTHPHNITIDNVLAGRLTRRGQNASVIFLSAVYDVHVRNVYADECDVGVFVFAGDYGYSFADKNAQWIGDNIVIENLSVVKHHAYGMRVLGKPYISGNNLPVPVVARNINTNGDPEGGGEAGVLLEYCVGVIVDGGRVAVADYGIKIGAGVNQCKITHMQVANIRRSGVFVYDADRPPEGTVLESLDIAMVNTSGATTGTDRAGIYVGSSSRTRILHNEFGLSNGEQGLYGIRVTAEALRPVLEGNYVRGVAAGGFAYALSAYGQALGQNNSAADGLTLFGDVKLPTRIGESYYWTDATGKMRVSGTMPTSDTSGVVVGTQA